MALVVSLGVGQNVLTLSLYHQVELTVHNFPALFAMKKAFTILFDENVREGTGAHKVLQDVVMSGAVKNNIFCWMDL